MSESPPQLIVCGCTASMCPCMHACPPHACPRSCARRRIRCLQPKHPCPPPATPSACQVGNRWDEFSGDERSQLATMSYQLLQQGAAPWAIRSKASLLLALVIKRSGPDLWEAALPQLLAAAASEGPAMQEQVGWLGCCRCCCMQGCCHGLPPLPPGAPAAAAWPADTCCAVCLATH